MKNKKLNLRRKVFFIILSAISFNANSGNIIVDTATISREATAIVAKLGMNCVNPAEFHKNVAYFMKEVSNILVGVGDVATQQTLQLALKRDYPLVCHVLTQAQIDSYTEGKDTSKKETTMLNLGKKIKKSTTMTTPIPSYYWPKYFIEVTEKGNDSHSAFSRANALYTANRKIAESLRKFVDVDGAVKLTTYVTGGKMMAEKMIPGFKVGDQDYERIAQAAILTPLEKMRIRANQKSNMTSYEATIWPVGLSETIAGHFTVCGERLIEEGKSPGGYSWPFKGVPMTCPVAMSNDAYAYWDTGMIDYIDPEAVSAMIAGSNPLGCGLAEGMANLSNLASGQSEGLGEKDKIDSSLAKLTDNLKQGLKACSWPILGVAQAVAMKALDATSAAKWKQTKCTLWGSISPRSSTSVYSSDYSYANTALKFKLLAHDLFGVPRGKEERWSLAYPWEGKGSAAGSAGGLEKVKGYLGKIGDTLKDMGIKLPDSSTSASRSESLYPPGHPALVNASFTTKFFSDRTKAVAKEAAYLGTLMAASYGAGSIVDKEMSKTKYDGTVNTDEMAKESEAAIGKAEEDTAHLEDEPIYQKVFFCHKSQKRGLIQGNQNVKVTGSFSVGTPYNGNTLPFAKVSDKNGCLAAYVYSGCLNVSHGICRDANKVLLVAIEKQEIIGYQKKQNPVFKKYQQVCKGLPVTVHRSKRKYFGIKHVSDDEFIYPYLCEDVEVGSYVVDTKQKIDRPTSIEKITSNDDTAKFIKMAAVAAPWVVAEVTRSKYGEILGYNYVSGDRRIYTIWEKISCKAKVKKVAVDVAGINVANNYFDENSGKPSCREAIRFEVYKYVQIKLLRKICDSLGQEEGEPWK